MTGIMSHRRGCIWVKRGGVPYDHFPRANTTAELGIAENGNTWGDTIGEGLRVYGEQAAMPEAGAGGQLLDIGSADQDFVFDINGWGSFRFYFRAIDADTCYWLSCTFGTTYLYKRIAGVDTLIEYAQGYLDTAMVTWHIEASGGLILVARDGQSFLSANDADYATINGHKAGLYLDSVYSRGDNFEPGSAVTPRFIRAYPLDGSVSLTLDTPRSHPEVTDYKVNIDGQELEYDATPIVVPDLTNFTEYPFTIQAKIGGDWGLASDTGMAYPGYADPPTITDITPLGGGMVRFDFDFGDAHGISYTDPYATFIFERDPGGAGETGLDDVYIDGYFRPFGIPAGTYRFRFWIAHSSYTPNYRSLSHIATPWTDPVTVT